MTDQKTLELERRAEEAEKEALEAVNEALAEWDKCVRDQSSRTLHEATARNVKEAFRHQPQLPETNGTGPIPGYSGISGICGVRGLGLSGVSGIRGLGLSGVSGIMAAPGPGYSQWHPSPSFIGKRPESSGVSGVSGTAPSPFVSGTQGFEWPAAARVREDLQHEWDARTLRCRHCNVPRSSVECGFNPLHLPDRIGGGWNCHRRYMEHLSPILRQIVERELEQLRIYGPDWIVDHEPTELERKVRLRNNSVQPLLVGPVGMLQPGETVEVPVAMVDASEVRTAIMLGWLTQEETDGSGRSRWFHYLFGNGDQRYGARP